MLGLIIKSKICSVDGFRKYLTPHIYKILEQNEAQFLSLQPYFKKVVQLQLNKDIGSVKIKLNMLYNVNNLPSSLKRYEGDLLERITNQQIKNQSQLDKIIDWLRINIKMNNQVGLEEALQIVKDVDNTHILDQHIKTIIQEGQSKKMGMCVSQVCKKLRKLYLNIDSKVIFQKVTNQLKRTQQKGQIKTSNHFWDKIGNIKPRIIQQECNDPLIYQNHLKITGGRPRFRFPPEPNGYLHIGHIKSIRINFQSALRLNGQCYLRYDDTNPDTQSQHYIRNIQHNVKWLGYTPHHITFASDYFENMLTYANQLIKQGLAYVCQSTQQQIQRQRKLKMPNKYRNRPIEQSLKIFPNLQLNQTLRLKGDYQSDNPNLRDPVMYRRKEGKHPKTGYKYKIYPIYDYAHCISDSIEHIDYSLCSLEFQVRRQLYYRYLKLLNLYKPNVWQYSRLNISNNLLSKRKIKQLVEQGKVSSWGDERLLTIQGLKGRGYTASMLLSFIDQVNASRAGNQNYVQYSLLQREMKKQLLLKAPKFMAVINPISLQIINFDEQRNIQVSLWNNFNERPQARIIKLTKTVLIDQKEKLQKDQIIILKYVGLFRIKTINKQKIQVQQILSFMAKKSNVRLDLIKNCKKLQWISPKQGVNIKIVYYEKLLNDDQSFNVKSKQQFQQCYVPKDLLKCEVQYWQFQRLGYFKWLTPGTVIQRCCPL